MSKEDSDQEALEEDTQRSAQGERGWWSQNWRWFLPTLLLTIIVLGGGAIYWSLFTRVYDLEACRLAMRAISADKQVREALGEPIETVKWPSRGTIPSARVEEREADIRWHIEGPKGRAEAHLFARMMMGKWETVTLDVTPANHKAIAVQEVGDTAAEAPAFSAPKAETKKPQSKAPPPEINMTIPPDGGK